MADWNQVLSINLFFTEELISPNLFSINIFTKICILKRILAKIGKYFHPKIKVLLGVRYV